VCVDDGGASMPCREERKGVHGAAPGRASDGRPGGAVGPVAGR
jgi:hypothetical protein